MRVVGPHSDVGNRLGSAVSDRLGRTDKARFYRRDTWLARLLLSQSGATVLEYAFIGALISVAAFSIIVSTGTSVVGLFQQVADSF